MTSPYWAHELLLWVQMIIPDALVGPALLSMHKVHSEPEPEPEPEP